MKRIKVINQVISLMLAIMLLMVAGARSWSGYSDSTHTFTAKSKEISRDLTQKGAPQSSDADQAKVSTLSLDAVITPAISFDFSHYFYFVPQPVWHFVVSESVVRVAFEESIFLVSYFHRIFGRFIVTNAP